MSLRALASMVKLSHSLFALPFVVAAVAIVARDATLDARRLALIAVAVVAARTAAMTMNRIADRKFDERNPRTSTRELVTGAVSPAAAWGLLVGSCAAFILSAALLLPLAGWLSPAVLAVLLGYSFAKRFTWACHLWLGAAQMLAPIGVAIALTGRPTFPSIALGLGVGAWIAGFDLFWALQDVDFDRGAGLHSIPVRFGERGSLAWARGLHALAAVCVAAAGPLAGRSWGWLAGSAILAAVLLLEHRHVAPGGALRRDRLNVAFFDYNAFASIAFALCALGDLALG